MEVRASKGQSVAFMVIGAVPACFFGAIWAWLALGQQGLPGVGHAYFGVFVATGLLLSVTGWRVGKKRVVLQGDRLIHDTGFGRHVVLLAGIAWARHVPNKLGFVPRRGKRHVVFLGHFPPSAVADLLGALNERVRIEEGGMGDWPYGHRGRGGEYWRASRGGA